MQKLHLKVATALSRSAIWTRSRAYPRKPQKEERWGLTATETTKHFVISCGSRKVGVPLKVLPLNLPIGCVSSCGEPMVGSRFGAGQALARIDRAEPIQ